MLKNLPASAEDRKNGVQFLSQEDHLQLEMATGSSIFAWIIPWTGELGGLQSMELQRVRHNSTYTQGSCQGVKFHILRVPQISINSTLDLCSGPLNRTPLRS